MEVNQTKIDNKYYYKITFNSGEKVELNRWEIETLRSLLNECLDSEYYDRDQMHYPDYHKNKLMITPTKDREIAKLKEQCEQEKKKNDELKKEIRKAKDDLAELKDYMSSTIASFFAAKDKKFLKKLERELMQKIMDNCCEDSEMEIELISER